MRDGTGPCPLLVDDSSLVTALEVRSRARRMKQRHPDLALVVIDYLQLLAPSGRVDNRVQQVSEITRALKVLAGDLDVPVLALSQLSRAPETRHDKRPLLSDLRESGSIEQDDPALIRDILREAPLPVRLLMPIIGPPVLTAHNKRLRRAGTRAGRLHYAFPIQRLKLAHCSH